MKSASNKLQKNNRFLDLYIVGHRFEIFVWEISSVSDFMCSSNTLQIIIRRPYKISLSPEIVDKFHETFCQSLLNIIQILSDIFKKLTIWPFFKMAIPPMQKYQRKLFQLSNCGFFSMFLLHFVSTTNFLDLLSKMGNRQWFITHTGWFSNRDWKLDWHNQPQGFNNTNTLKKPS